MPCTSATRRHLAQLAQAREKAFRAPVLMLAFARAGLPGDEMPLAERLLSAGCAIQNMLLMATALGFGSALTSGKALQSRALRELFSLGAGEQALCFVSIGTVSQARRPSAPPVRAKLRERTRSATMSQPMTIRSLSRSAGASFAQPFEMLEACHERVHRMLTLLFRLRDHLRAHGADDHARAGRART